MEWLGKIVDTVAGGLPGAAAGLVPDHFKRKWLERLGDHNPFKTISANHDLVRATRLAWIEAAQDILKEARQLTNQREWEHQAGTVGAFDALITDILLDARDHAFDRRKDPGPSPIDAHVQAVINGVPELVSPGDHAGIGASVTTGFTGVLSALTGWGIHEVPAVYGQIAQSGLATHGSGPSRAFGELVFAAFAELIKDPKKYPQAREAFYIAMDKLGRDIGQATLAAVTGLDHKLDAMTAGLDGLQVFRAGTILYLEMLPEIARGVASANDKIDALPDAVAEKLVAELDRRDEVKAAQSAGVERFAIVQLAKRISAHVSDFGQALLELERAVEIAIKVQADGARGTNTDNFVDEVLRRVAALSAKGQHKDAGTEADKAFVHWERDEAERQDAALQTGVKLLEASINQALLARNTANAAERIARKSDLETPDTASRFEALRKVQDSYYVRGRDKGLNLDLEVSIEIARIMLSRAQSQDERGAALNVLANALQVLGERENGTQRLEEAISTYQAALEEYKQERVPLDWASTQNNLGNALCTLEERENDTQRLEEAVTAYQAALEERTRDRVPLHWAMTQNNLGTALHRLGERENGTQRLAEAILAFQAALEECTQERVPLHWATTQNNLGNALRTLGERENDTQRLEEAILAYQAALEEYTQERVPLDWAMTQNNLGTALRTLGERENDTKRLEGAILAFQSALEERTRDRVPLHWATTQNNLGNALHRLGERENGTQRLEEAILAYQAALAEYTKEHFPLYWSMSFGNQGVAMLKIAERRSDLELAQMALDQINAAFHEWKNGGHAPYASFFKQQLISARELVEKLSG